MDKVLKGCLSPFSFFLPHSLGFLSGPGLGYIAHEWIGTIAHQEGLRLRLWLKMKDEIEVEGLIKYLRTI